MPEWLIYHDNFGVLVCRAHSYAVLNLHSHLKKKHLELTPQERNDIASNYSDLDLGNSSEHRLCHGFCDPIPAIDGLPVPRGYACMRTGCGFLTGSWKCLRNHNNQKHRVDGASHGRRRHRAQSQSWTSVQVQTFLTGPRSAVRYFCVETSGVGPGPPPQHRSPAVVKPGPAGPRWVSTGVNGSLDGRSDDHQQLIANIREQ